MKNKKQEKIKEFKEIPLKDELKPLAKVVNKVGEFENTDEVFKEIKKLKLKDDLKNPETIKKFASSDIPRIRAIGARLAVEIDDEELQKEFAKDKDPEVLKEISKSKSPAIFLEMLKNPNATGEQLDLIKQKVFNDFIRSHPHIALRLLKGIINHRNVFTETLASIVYYTHNTRILLMLLNCDKLNSGLLMLILKKNYLNSFLVLRALKKDVANINHFKFVIRKTDDQKIIRFCAKQRNTKIIEFMAGLNKGVEYLLKNAYITTRAIFTIIKLNIERFSVLQKALKHRKAISYEPIWEFVIKNSKSRKILDFCAGSKIASIRLRIARLYSLKLSQQAFRRLLEDPVLKVSEALKEHENEEVRLRVAKFTNDKDYLKSKAAAEESGKIKIAIAKRKELSKEVELSLLENENKQVFLALARRTGDITTTTEEKLALTKDADILTALSKREYIKSKTALQILAGSGIEEIEFNLISNKRHESIHKFVILNSLNLKVLIYAIKNSDINTKIALAQRNFEGHSNLLKIIALEILKQPQARVRRALLYNRQFLEQMWALIHRKELQTETNPFYTAFIKIQNDNSDLVKKRFEKIKSRLSEIKQREIKKMYLKERKKEKI